MLLSLALAIAMCIERFAHRKRSVRVAQAAAVCAPARPQGPAARHAQGPLGENDRRGLTRTCTRIHRTRAYVAQSNATCLDLASNRLFVIASANMRRVGPQ